MSTSRRCFRRSAAWLSLCFFAALCTVHAATSSINPRSYHTSGRVVRNANGEYSVLWGLATMQFPASEQRKLQPYLGQFVRVDYRRVANEQSLTGSVIEGIEKIDVLAKSPMDMTLAVSVKPAKRVFRFGEPIEVTVTISSNQTGESPLLFNVSHAVLFQDYERKLMLEPDGHYSDPWAYKFPGGIAPRTIRQGQQVEFSIKSSRVAEPGLYDLIFVLSNDATRCSSLSEPQQIEVLPADAGERRETLRSWLKTGTFSQRVKIAETLGREGDAEAVSEFLAQLKAGVFSLEGRCYTEAFRCAFEYGGEAGARIMVDMIKEESRQDRAVSMMEDIYFAKNRVPLLQELLACDHPTYRHVSGWTYNPRICDLAAEWLMRRTEPRMEFPQDGSLKARDGAVSAVRSMLEKNPVAFQLAPGHL